MLLTQNSSAIIYSEDIKKICLPLKKLGIHFFNYQKNFDNGAEVSLSTHPEWLTYFYTNDLYNLGDFEGNSQYYTSGYALFSALPSQKIFEAAKSNFGIQYGICLICKNKNNAEFFYFSATENTPEIINFYLNNLDLLFHFATYFKTQAQEIIEKATKNALWVPTNLRTKKPIICNTHQHFEKEEFLKETQLKHLFINIENNQINLTKSEIECLSKLLMGKTSKEIAQLLSKSPRTIERHLEDIRVKLGCHNKASIISTLLKHLDCFYKDLQSKILI